MADVKDYPPYLDYPKERKKQTNADRIRQMSDEELAEWWVEADACIICESGFYPNCKACKLEWLKQEVQDATD